MDTLARIAGSRYSRLLKRPGTQLKRMFCGRREARRGCPCRLASFTDGTKERTVLALLVDRRRAQPWDGAVADWRTPEAPTLEPPVPKAEESASRGFPLDRRTRY
jgi:hypothetical protein